MIRNNAKEFCEVTDPDDIMGIMKEITAGSGGITNTFLQKNIKNLQTNISKTTEKIKSFMDNAG